MSRVLFAVSFLVCLLFAAGCSSPDSKLRARAAEYYNSLTGANNKTYDEFMTPALLASMSSTARKGMQEMAGEIISRRKELQEKKGITPASIAPKQISIKIDGKWGITTLPGVLEPPIVRVRVIWILDEGKWYRFASDSSETAKYGSPPESLMSGTLPVLPPGVRDKMKENAQGRIEGREERRDERRDTAKENLNDKGGGK